MSDKKVTYGIFGKDHASPAFDSAGRSAGKTGKILGGLGKGLVKVGKMASLGLAAGVGIAGFALKGFVADAEESRKVSKLTESIIKSTGGAAKLTAKQVGDLATAISNKTGVDDEMVQSGANLLLTFKNVRNEVGKGANVFDRATQSAVDLSAAGFGDVAGASKMLGKALNDPIKGISALGRAGVTFSEAQKKQIKTMVEAGNALGAQKIILGEVESQVGGAAAATGSAMDKLKVIFGNAGEAIGTELLPYIDKAAAWLGKRLPGAIEKTTGFIKSKVVPAFKAVAGFISDKVVPAVKSLVAKFRSDVVPILQRFADFVMSRVVPALKDSLPKALAGAKSAFDNIKKAIRDNRPQIEQIISVLGKLVTFAVKNIGPIVGKQIKQLGTTIGFVVDVVGTLWKAFAKMAQLSLNALGLIVNGAAKAFGWVPGLGGKLKAAAKKFNEFKADVNRALGGIKNKHFTITATTSQAVKAVAALNAQLRQTGRGGHVSINGVGTGIMMAEGGIVKARRGGTAAIIGEAGHDEAVIPLSGPNAPKFMGGGTQAPIIVQLVVDGKTLAQSLVTFQRQNGGSLPMLRTS